MSARIYTLDFFISLYLKCVVQVLLHQLESHRAMQGLLSHKCVIEAQNPAFAKRGERFGLFTV